MADVWKLFGLFSFDIAGRTAYWYSYAVAFLMFAFARRLVNSPFGLSLRGIRENSRRMPAIGSPVTWRLVAVFTVSITSVTAREKLFRGGAYLLHLLPMIQKCESPLLVEKLLRLPADPNWLQRLPELLF